MKRRIEENPTRRFRKPKGFSAYLTKEEIAALWTCSTRTVLRILKEGGVRPTEFFGISQPLYTPQDVTNARASWVEKRLQKRDTGTGIITIKEAKRLAGRGRK